MSANLPTNIQVERLDDLPLLMENLKRMEIAQLIDENIPTHGNWQGLSLGWTVTVWLAHILSQADHRLVHVQEWVAAHLRTLQELTGIEYLMENIQINTDNNQRELQERRLIVRSETYAHSQETSLEERLAKAEKELLNLAQRKRGKKRLATLAEME